MLQLVIEFYTDLVHLHHAVASLWVSDDMQSKELWESVWSQGRGVLCVDRQIGSQSYVEYDEEESSGNYESESAESTGISIT